MPLPTSHKNPSAASADHYQSRELRNTSKAYGTETGAHPGRQVGRVVGPGIPEGRGALPATAYPSGTSFPAHPGAELEERYGGMADLMSTAPGYEPTESESRQRGF